MGAGAAAAAPATAVAAAVDTQSRSMLLVLIELGWREAAQPCPSLTAVRGALLNSSE